MTTPRSPSSFGSPPAIASAARRITLKLPIKLISIVRRKLSSPCAPLRPKIRSAGATPAQLITPCNAPKTLTAEAIAARQSISLVMSARTKIARFPSSSARAAPAASFTSTSTTFAPRPTNSRAEARPSPEPAPVTRKTEFSMRIMFPQKLAVPHTRLFDI